MPKFVFSIITLLMFSVLLSGCSAAAESEDDTASSDAPFQSLESSYTDATHTDLPETVNVNNLTSFKDDGRNNTSNNALPAIAVLMTKDNVNKDITNYRITGSVVEFNYNNTGDLTADNLNFYFSDKKYNVNTNNIDNFELTIGKIGPVATNYMGLVNWQMAEANAENNEINDYEAIGFAITGFETATNNIPLFNEIEFKGKGKGYYSDGTTHRHTNFDFLASFTSYGYLSNINGNLTVTHDGSDSDLNFYSYFSNSANTNKMSEEISTSEYALSGTFDARFYGPYANELGGTFSMNNYKESYIGWFGAIRVDGIVSLPMIDKTLNSETLTLDDVTISDNHLSLTEVASNGDGITAFNMKALAVYRHDVKESPQPPEQDWLTTTITADILQTINLERRLGSVASFTFNNEGTLADVTIHGIEIDANRPADQAGFFGFTANYMAYINLNVTQDAGSLTEIINNTEGYMMAGIETKTIDLSATDNQVTFTGKGKGTHIYNDERSLYTFTTNATVYLDREELKIDITSDTSTNSSHNTYNLNLSVTTGYAGNNITSDTIRARDPRTYASLTGTLDARFYGGNMWELGGTFALISESGITHYYGAFGAHRNGISALTTPDFTFNSETLIPTVSISDNYLSLTDAASNGDGITAFNMKALAVYKNSKIDYTRAPKQDWATRADKVQTYSLERRLGSVASLIFNSGGTVADLTIDGIETNPSQPDNQSEILGFTPAYMTYINLKKIPIENILNNSDDVAAITNDIDGYMIAGIETKNDDIPTDKKAVQFKGKGHGNYIRFDDANMITHNFSYNLTTNATVDFGAKNVNINLSRSGTSETYGNISTGIISFDGNEITADVTATGYALTGTLDARFYGSGAKEFGGTFLLTSDNSYYYGAFGGKQGISSVFYDESITTFVTTPSIADNGLTSFSEGGSDDNVFALENAVQIFNNIYIGKITGAVVEYDSSPNKGAFKDSGLKLYFSDTIYEITSDADIHDDSRFSNYYIKIDNDTVIDSGSKLRPSELTLNTSARHKTDELKADYMASVVWNGNGGYGFATTGFETIGNDIPGIDEAKFKGAGRGQYSSTVASTVSTYFGFTANIDFTERTARLFSFYTCAHPYRADNSCYNKRDDLTFRGTLSYQPKTNAFTGTISSGNLIGTADARFYGPAANEFGGTFAIYSGEAAHVGFFMSGRDYIIAADTEEVTTVTTITDFPTGINKNNLTGFNDANRVVAGTGTTGNALKITDIVRVTRDVTTKIITSDIIKGAVVEFDYKNDGDFADDGATLYFIDKKYDVTGTGNINAILSATASSGTAMLYSFALSRTSSDFFGFTANYMAGLSWRDARRNSFSYGITGFETKSDDFPGTGNAQFTGLGYGKHYTLAEEYYFNITADIDFGDSKSVTLTSSNTCDYRYTFFCGDTYKRTSYNFTGTLNYNTNTKALTGTLTTTSGFKGDAYARFYGTGTNGAKEIGGTFNFERVFLGYFGVSRYITSHSDIATANDIGAPTTFNQDNLTGFNDSNRVTHGTPKEDIALKATAVEIVKDISNITITTRKISDAVVEFDYATSTNFANTGLIFYFADRKYEVTAGDGQQDYITATTIDSGSADNPTEFGVQRHGNSVFGYRTSHMALVYWELDEAGYDSKGFAITGFETTDNGVGGTIPSTGIAEFKGKGQGQHYYRTVSDDVYFDVTANVDFSTGNVALIGENTCNSRQLSNCRSAANLRPHLDFTANILEYDVGMNNISGMIETAGDADNGIEKLTGTADARFYGPNTEELGGTFSMSNSDAGYIGYFGAKKEE
ncbi:MAG: transferrin-binding protein-like solute binding protein [Alphaproteobacteria bacterium]|nr:transferrin-binding protein-like solute binding protein [Alphaproteobacteria bacterium]